ncbi:cell division cycle protein 37 [Geosmithia morbida]|uniref:Hsp90 chaperone protein kinase-targeting subunit n=1 Tax=Geosmithia morbida TaxID=1094350 RepID=A0A9P5D4C0_9HYPO|nr:cell division cycle protein 37 [Geosmithia morbida]KAF4121339.1 cell division cycle protein 37 [Geosmithia morbida]
MPVDYSKWDNLELSDDSDIEVHPNVDKRSFIRAKQNQIHQERQQRKHQIETLKYERIINDGLLKRISSLLAALRARASETTTGGRNAGEVAFQAVMESAGKPEDDKPPPRPEGVHSADGSELPSFSQMMITLLDQVNKALDEKKPEDRYAATIDEVQGHEDKVVALQRQLEEKLAELEKVDRRKITSEAYHTGFDSSHVSKATAADRQKQQASGAPAASAQPQLLNPNFQSAPGPAASTTTGGGGGDDGEEIEASEAGKKFARIKPQDYAASARFISQNPQILTERETDGLLVMAFDAALEGKDEFARQCVHQGLLLQYCRSLGPDGVGLFFRRITTRGHQAQEVFAKDVQDTYMRIRNRSREIVRERALEKERGADAGVEQIQLHAMEPGTVINIRIPPAVPDDQPDGEGVEEARRARAIFESFKPDMRKALESESLDEVNKVLGEMSVEEAEEIVNLFGEANILSLEEQIIDATTEEGQKQLKELEKEAARDKAGEAPKGDEEQEKKEEYPDPE